MDRPALSIIIPAYNEAENLPGLLHDVSAHLDKLSAEFIVVDDSSTDSTFEVASSLSKTYPVKVIRKGLPRGIGSGIRAGIAAASGNVGVVVMADNVDDFTCLPKFYHAIMDGCRLAVCSRYKSSQNSVNIPAKYKFWSKVYRIVSRVFLGIPLSDLTNAYRAFDLDFVRGLNLKSTGFQISAELTFKVWFASRKVCEVEGLHRKRERGKSNFSFRKFGFGYLVIFIKAFIRRFTGVWL